MIIKLLKMYSFDEKYKVYADIILLYWLVCDKLRPYNFYNLIFSYCFYCYVKKLLHLFDI